MSDERRERYPDEEIHRERETMRAEWWRQREEIATVAEENARLRAELEAVTALRDSWKNSAEEISAGRDTWKKACDGWTRVGTDALATISRVRSVHARDGSNPRGPWCGTCMTAWPCRTVRTLEGEQP